MFTVTGQIYVLRSLSNQTRGEQSPPGDYRRLHDRGFRATEILNINRLSEQEFQRFEVFGEGRDTDLEIYFLWIN